MSEKSSKVIRNSVIASLIASLIISAIQPLRNFAVYLLKSIWSGIIWGWNAIFDLYSLPGWAFLFIFFLSMLGIIQLYRFFRKSSIEPEILKYTQDSLHNAKWRWQWQWVGKKVAIKNLWCFCPSCDGELVYDDSSCRSFYADVKKTDFICENCNRKISTIEGGNKSYVLGVVEREVLRRIRTNTYELY